ncbi:MAG: class I SAM-dependent methyltransferase [Alkalispirochaeta sp.]
MKRERWNERYITDAATWPDEPCPVVVDTATSLSAGVAPEESRRPRRALDLACGTGRNARYLAHHGWIVTAVDYAQEGITYGRGVAEDASLTIDWRVADLVTWQPEQEQYDLVLICYLHLPWSEMETVIQSAWSAVASGGRLVVVGHDRTNLEHGTGGPQHPEVLYVPHQVTTLLRTVFGDSVAVIREEQSRYEVDHGEAAGTGAEQIDCVVVAGRPQ